jgi:hypothetical protein
VGFNELNSKRPELAKQWNSNRNVGLSPSDVLWTGRDASYWWDCDKGHTWKATLASRNIGSGCPVCANQLIEPGVNDMASTHPEIAASFHPSKNLGSSPEQIFAGTGAKFWWKCELGHEWKTTANSRFNGTGCPDCAEYGFKPNKPAIFYFIENKSLRARKIGITNIEDRAVRLSRFSALGWKQLHVVENDNGAGIRELEGFMKKWIRKDLKLPQYLSAEEMGLTGGWTETFSIEGPSNEAVKKMIKIGCERLGLL